MAVYELKTFKRGQRPRSERLRELGGESTGGGSTVVTVNGSGSAVSPNDHYHANKQALDQISTDADGYEYLTRQKETTDDKGNAVYEQITEKVNWRSVQLNLGNMTKAWSCMRLHPVWS